MYIVTHPGQAHLDDFIACSLILAKHQVSSIHRRDPDDHEMLDPEVWVVDVGMDYDLMLNNYDHHQEDPCLPAIMSSASLVADALGLDHTVFNWWEGVDRMDCAGPFKTAEWVGTTWDQLSKVSNPIGNFMVAQFARCEKLDFIADPHLWEMMKLFGESLFEQSEYISKRLKELDGLVTIEERKGLKWAIMLDPSGLRGLEIWVQQNHPDVAGTISLDDRGSGLCLFRRNDHPRVDFSWCKEELANEIKFVHKNGFVIKLKTRDMDVAWKAVEIACLV